MVINMKLNLLTSYLRFSSGRQGNRSECVLFRVTKMVFEMLDKDLAILLCSHLMN